MNLTVRRSLILAVALASGLHAASPETASSHGAAPKAAETIRPPDASTQRMIERMVEIDRTGNPLANPYATSKAAALRRVQLALQRFAWPAADATSSRHHHGTMAP